MEAADAGAAGTAAAEPCTSISGGGSALAQSVSDAGGGTSMSAAAARGAPADAAQRCAYANCL